MGGKGSALRPQAERAVSWQLSAAKEAEKAAGRLREEYKTREKAEAGGFPSLSQKDDDVVTKMNDLAKMQGIIQDSVIPNALPEGAYNPNAVRKVVGKGMNFAKDKKRVEPLVGITEAELRTLLDMRMTQPEMCTASLLAEKFKIKADDVKVLLRFTSPVVPIPDPKDPKVYISKREFDAHPER